MGISLLPSALSDFSVKQTFCLWPALSILKKVLIYVNRVTFELVCHHFCKRCRTRSAMWYCMQQFSAAGRSAHGRVSGQEQVKRKWVDANSGREHNAAKENRGEMLLLGRKAGWRRRKAAAGKEGRMERRKKKKVLISQEGKGCQNK